MQHIDPEHHDGTSDATPGGASDQRRPGELVFAGLMLAVSLGLFWSAYGISGFEALSAPGSVPMATTVVQPDVVSGTTTMKGAVAAAITIENATVIMARRRIGDLEVAVDPQHVEVVVDGHSFEGETCAGRTVS